MNLNLNNPIVERKTKTVYKDEGKSIKLFVEEYSKSDILNEALNQSRVEEHSNLNVPSLLEVSKNNNRWALISEYIEGKTLQELMEEFPEKEQEYLEKFVDIQVEVLGNTVPLLNRIKDKYKRKLEEFDTLDNNIKYELLQRLEGMKNHNKLCHGDFNPSNIIIKEDGTHFVIDWAHVTQGNASADAARTYLIFCLEGKNELAEKYLEMFIAKSGIGKGNIQRWIPIVAAVEMAKASEEDKKMLEKWVDILEFQ